VEPAFVRLGAAAAEYCICSL